LPITKALLANVAGLSYEYSLYAKYQGIYRLKYLRYLNKMSFRRSCSIKDPSDNRRWARRWKPFRHKGGRGAAVRCQYVTCGEVSHFLILQLQQNPSWFNMLYRSLDSLNAYRYLASSS